MGLCSETHPHLGVDVGHDDLAVLVCEGAPQLVVDLFDTVKAHSGDDGTVGNGARGLGGGERIEGSPNADLAAAVHGRVTEGKDFKFQPAKYESCVLLR